VLDAVAWVDRHELADLCLCLSDICSVKLGMASDSLCSFCGSSIISSCSISHPSRHLGCLWNLQSKVIANKCGMPSPSQLTGLMSLIIRIACSREARKALSTLHGLGLPAFTSILATEWTLFNQSTEHLIFSNIIKMNALLAYGLNMPDHEVKAPAYPLQILWQEPWTCVQFT
jgi:hypothetical protein